ncbi:MAG: hypothetical protein LDL24_02370 [Treponema sp.]|nr:hypothetical protein [Treponema sp.]
MDIKSAMLRFLKSPLGLIVMGLNILGAALAMLLFHFPIMVVLPVFIVIALADVIVLLQTETGARSVIAEQDRERAERDARILGGVAAARKRLSMLRFDTGPVKEAVDQLVFAAGLYLEATVKGSGRDPLIEDAIIGALEVVDEYLHQIDMIKSESLLTSGEGQDARIKDFSAHTAAIVKQSVEEVTRRLGQIESQ